MKVRTGLSIPGHGSPYSRGLTPRDQRVLHRDDFRAHSDPPMPLGVWAGLMMLVACFVIAASLYGVIGVLLAISVLAGLVAITAGVMGILACLGSRNAL